MNVLMGIGDMPHDRVVKSMELFAGRVVPAFRDARPPAGGPAPAPPP